MSTTSLLLLMAGSIIGAGFGYFFQASRTFDREHGPRAEGEAKPPAPVRS